jgi:hypothetical protein
MQPRKTNRLDPISTDIQRSGSSNHKNLTDWIIYVAAKTDLNDYVVTEIQHNGSIGDKIFRSVASK